MTLSDIVISVGAGLAAVLNSGTAAGLLMRARGRKAVVTWRGDQLSQPRLRALSLLGLAVMAATIGIDRLTAASDSTAGLIVTSSLVAGSLVTALTAEYVRSRRLRIGTPPTTQAAD
jgi:hypothetical protein